MTTVNLAEIYNIAPTPTTAVTKALRPSLNSLVRLSPTIPESLPNLDIISPVLLTPVSLTISLADTGTGVGVDEEAVVDLTVAEGDTSEILEGLTVPCKSNQPISCLKTLT